MTNQENNVNVASLIFKEESMGIVLNQAAEGRAEKAATAVRYRSRTTKDTSLPKVAILFTSGLEQLVEWDQIEFKVPLDEIEGFEELKNLGQVKGHSRELFLAQMGNIRLWGLAGRIHLNENPFNAGPLRQMVRLQYDLLAKLGVETLILTSAVGSCRPCVRIGQIGVIESCLRDSGTILTGCSGEFGELESALCPQLQRIALEARPENQDQFFRTIPVTHHFWLGPDIESPQIKRLLAQKGADVVGMSSQPGIEAAMRQGVKVLALGYVTNGFTHDHDAVIDAAQTHGPDWMAHLIETITTIHHA
ncbi:hypothetical protein ACFLZY_02565 [Patescibacteria group bacterium]